MKRIGTREMQGLDGNFALQLGIESQIDDALRPPPQLSFDFETPNLSAHFSISSIQTRCGTPSGPPLTSAFCP
ncbi:hypothetical protein SDC9_148767 [bioreactor metagenome]|uniref:Uncharacterized protein n=1 Tax=bioreactor metagenome TaxID=1076179 RepID=A0A645EHS0_9ZZZZ